MEENSFDHSFSVESLFGLPELPESVEVMNYTSSDVSIPIKTDAFTIVLSRDVRRNAFLAAELALKAALADKQTDVWYVNTYAGVNLLKESFRKLFSEAGLKIGSRSMSEEEEATEALSRRPDKVRYWDRPLEEHIGTYTWVPQHRTYSRQTLTPEEKAAEAAILAAEKAEDEAWNSRPFKGGGLDPALALPNLRIYHVPIGSWDTKRITRDIQERGRMDCKQVVIINSFEFAPLTQGRKDRMARELLQLCDKLQLSIVIFSHEMKRDIEPGLPGRGPIGILAAKAASISRVADPFEKFYGSRNQQKQAENGIIHEKQIYSSPFSEIVKGALAD